MRLWFVYKATACFHQNSAPLASHLLSRHFPLAFPGQAAVWKWGTHLPQSESKACRITATHLSLALAGWIVVYQASFPFRLMDNRLADWLTVQLASLLYKSMVGCIIASRVNRSASFAFILSPLLLPFFAPSPHLCSPPLLPLHSNQNQTAAVPEVRMSETVLPSVFRQVPRIEQHSQRAEWKLNPRGYSLLSDILNSRAVVQS